MKHVESGLRWVVDIDLEKFFDRVHHDTLMSLVKRKVGDRLVLSLIGSYLKAGILEGGVTSPRVEGTPQGGPLSPLLSNILLDELDKELDGWVRRKLRRILWKQWKRPYTRAKNLMRRRLSESTAWRSATNGHGPWWNAGAAYMNKAVLKSYFDKLGLVSFTDRLHRLQHTS